MNKRIKKLAEQAGMNAFEPTMDYDRKETHWTGWDANLEKFAKLIVQECVDFTNTYNVNGKSIVGQVIKEHFGVKE